MKTYTKEILILLLGLLGAMPMLKGQIATISTKRSTPNVKITIHENYLNKIPQSELNSYLDALLQWADSGLKNKNSNTPMPSLPPSIKDMDVNINTEKINDVISIEITVNKTAGEDRIQFKSIERDTIEPEKPEFRRPKQRLRQQRMALLKNRHKIKKIVTYSHFDLGFLTVNSRPPIPNGTAPPPPRDFHRMPELDNFRTLQIGFEKDWGYNLYKGKLRFWFGVNYNIQNYRFRDNNVRLKHNASEFEYEIAPPAQNPNDNADKSKIVTNYLGIPISIGLQNKQRNPSFSLKLGIQGGYLVRCHSKVRTYGGEKIKYFDDFNMNDIAIHPFASVKLKNLEFYAKYGLTNIFKNHQGAPSNNLAFGIVLSTIID
jgi:hypothetical protein